MQDHATSQTEVCNLVSETSSLRHDWTSLISHSYVGMLKSLCLGGQEVAHLVCCLVHQKQPGYETQNLSVRSLRCSDGNLMSVTQLDCPDWSLICQCWYHQLSCLPVVGQRIDDLVCCPVRLVIVFVAKSVAWTNFLTLFFGGGINRYCMPIKR